MSNSARFAAFDRRGIRDHPCKGLVTGAVDTDADPGRALSCFGVFTAPRFKRKELADRGRREGARFIKYTLHRHHRVGPMRP